MYSLSLNISNNIQPSINLRPSNKKESKITEDSDAKNAFKNLMYATAVAGMVLVGYKSAPSIKKAISKYIPKTEVQAKIESIVTKEATPTKQITQAKENPFIKKDKPIFVTPLKDYTKKDINAPRQYFIPDEERLSRIFNKLHHVWNKDGKVSPEKIDEILTRHVGGNNWTREIKFYPNEKLGIDAGRKKSYRTKGGNIFVLESHTGKDGIVTRCYMAIGNDRIPLAKEDRLYLCSDGIFEPGQYFARTSHLKSTDNAVDWIKQGV